MRVLYYGDNLQVLRDSIASESVDLIHLDPPSNTSGTRPIRRAFPSRPYVINAVGLNRRLGGAIWGTM